ncbi:esterase B1-like [Danaus plexippus]|uniref:esterase B1-like n=1 Tax=Danaus plexippus TaxID=13037 RepID=UPI002AB05112|nr:esterase B1-like [Danaus plexippus]
MMLLLVLLVVFMTIDESEQNVVSIAQGRIRGVQKRGYITYGGIPYTTVSGMPGRFKSGGLAPVWPDIRGSQVGDCTTTSPVEDCLQLDVNVPPGSLLPVMVWVTGGSGHYDPTMLVEQQILVVIVRHRLGPTGFLCSREDKIAGNAGLKDVVLALRWVRDNIVAFDGNPNMVVVAGQSFGAAMVQSLILSNMARGLFHGAIIQSGSVLAPWAFNFDAEQRAKFLKMKFNESRDSFTLVRAGTADLARKADELDFPYLPFGICVENPMKNEEIFLSDSPFDLLSNGKIISVPIIMGYTNNEAYIFSSMLKEVRVLKKMAKEINFLIPIELQTSKRDVLQLAKKVKEMYFPGNITMKSVLKYHRDAYFLSHIYKSIRFLTASSSRVYFYQFSHSGSVGVEEEPDVIKDGAAHSDELAYLFPDKGRKLDGDDGDAQRNVVKLWTNFVKYLNPTPQGELGLGLVWEPYSPYDNRVLTISTELEMIDFPYNKEMQMWDHVYEQFHHERRRKLVV